MGTIWRRSGSFEFDANGERAGSAKAYFFEGSSTTPLTVYQNSALDIPHDTPVLASGVGRWPPVYIDFIDTYDEQIKTSGGSQLTYYTGISNPDPNFSATPEVDTPAALQTGDWKFSDVDETKTGFVRANGRTIGSASSGATERAHADCEPLFTYRWDKIGNGQAAVSGGRGASAAADFAANKTIALPDCRGAYPLGLDTMGTSAASSMALVPFTTGGSSTPGSSCGSNTHTLTTAQLAVTTPTGTIGYAGNFTPAGTVTKPTITVSDTHTHAGGGLFDTSSTNTFAGGGTTAVIAVNNGGSESTGGIDSGDITAVLDATPAFTGTAAALPAATFTGDSVGSGAPHNVVSKAVLGSWYIKL